MLDWRQSAVAGAAAAHLFRQLGAVVGFNLNIPRQVQEGEDDTFKFENRNVDD